MYKALVIESFFRKYSLIKLQTSNKLKLILHVNDTFICLTSANNNVVIKR